MAAASARPSKTSDPLAKLDWNISDRQRASLTYQRTEETRPTPYSARVNDNTVVLSSNWYTINSKTDNYSPQPFSDWTDDFSTVKVGYQNFANNNGAAIDQPEIWLQIRGVPEFPAARSTWAVRTSPATRTRSPASAGLPASPAPTTPGTT
ncbi:MAG: hypothetical protein U1F20_06500 [Lysobacterales bacterium]